MSALPSAACTDGVTSFEMTVGNLVSFERARAGLRLAPLLFDARLQASALSRGEDMAVVPCLEPNSGDCADSVARIAQVYPDCALLEELTGVEPRSADLVPVWRDSE